MLQACDVLYCQRQGFCVHHLAYTLASSVIPVVPQRDVYMQLVNMGVPLTWSLVDPMATHDPRFQACPFRMHKADALARQQMPMAVHLMCPPMPGNLMCPPMPGSYTNVPAGMCLLHLT